MKIRKILSIVLIFTLVAGILPTAVFAKEPSEVSAAASTEFTPTATITQVFGNRKAIFSPTFDDSLYTTATFINELCKEYDVRASIMLWCNRIGSTSSNMADAETWAALFAEGYLEPQNHSMTHMDLRDTTDKGALNQDPEKFQSEIVDSKLLLEELFPEYDIITYAIPYGGMSSAAKTLAQQHHYALRGVYGGDYQSLDPGIGTGRGTWGNIISPGAETADDKTQIAYLKNLLDTAVKVGGWHAPFIHAAGDVSNTEMNSTVATEYFKYMGEYNASGDAWCTTFSNATKYIRERQNTTVSVRYDGAKIYVKLDMAEKTQDGLPLSPDVFNHPLTVKVKVPSTFVSPCVRGKDGFIPSTLETEKGEFYTYIDIVPNGEEYEISSEHEYTQFRKASSELHYAKCDCGVTDTLPHSFNSFGLCEECQVNIEKISLSAGSLLSMNYYVYVSDRELSFSSKPEMRFTVDGNETTVSEYERRDNLYVFTLDGIAPYDMAKSIGAEFLIDGEAVDAKADYSAEQYCKDLLEIYKDDKEVCDVANSLLIYAKKLGIFVKNEDSIGLGMSLAANSYAPSEADNKKSVTGNGSNGLRFDSAALKFGKDARAAFKIYAEDSDFTVYITSSASEFSVRYSKEELEDNGGGCYTAYSRAIHPEFFDDAIVAKIVNSDGVTVAEYTYSANTYAYECSQSETASAAEKELATALYRYGKSIENYIKK